MLPPQGGLTMFWGVWLFCSSPNEPAAVFLFCENFTLPVPGVFRACADFLPPRATVARSKLDRPGRAIGGVDFCLVLGRRFPLDRGFSGKRAFHFDEFWGDLAGYERAGNE